MANDRDVEREKQMARMYQAGSTLTEIGESYGLTRERVRQLLKRQGVSASDGGKAKRARDRAQSEEERKEANCQKRWGISREEYAQLRAMADNWWETPMGQYVRHRQNAITRGIEWHLDFPKWWRIWEQSGKYHQRGHGGDFYVMARYGDQGPYSIENVRITSNRENVREYRTETRPRRELTETEVFIHRLRPPRGYG